MKLSLVRSVDLVPTRPFHFDATFHKPDHFTSGDNLWVPGVRWQTCHWRGEHLGLKFAERGTRDKPRVQMVVYAARGLDPDVLDSLVAEVRWRFNLDLDLAPFYRAFARDPLLGPVIKRWRGMRPGHPSSLYEYLIIGVVLQNATVRRSIQMFQALLEAYGERIEYDGRSLWCFWEPGGLRDVSERELRARKLGYRARPVRRIDRAFAEGRIDEPHLRERDMETQRDALLALYGVGPATVGYLLSDVFHRWDFFEHVPPWEQKIYSRILFARYPGRPVPVKKILRRIARYRPHQQIAVHYLWEDLWWRRMRERIPWLERLVRA